MTNNRKIITAPFGTWESPLGAEDLAVSSIRLAEPRVFKDQIFWAEGRPKESGRTAIVRFVNGRASDLGPPQSNVRSLVHEYGGGAWIPTKLGVIGALFDDQRLYHFSNSSLSPLTIEPSIDRGYRYADPCLLPDEISTIWVFENHDHKGNEPTNSLILVDPDGSFKKIAEGHDFYSSPVCSPDGSQIAYIAWDHPSMPWDRTFLRVIDLEKNEVVNDRIVLEGFAFQQPRWSPTGQLHVISDETGFWNIHSVNVIDKSSTPIINYSSEFGIPGWVFAQCTYQWSNDNIWCSWVDHGVGHIGFIEENKLNELETNFTEFGRLDVLSDGRVVTVAASWTAPSVLVAISKDGTTEILNNQQPSILNTDNISQPELISFTSGDNLEAHAFYFEPKNENFQSLNELPPLIVLSHGGPTSSARSSFDPTVQFWTNRGFAVVDVNYGGSTGFGTEYRNRLKGNWGITDTQDCVEAAKYLAENGFADSDRLIIKGGSAGGYTTLCALTWHNIFAAGISRYGVADLETLARDTHKFESKYLDSLIGPWPEESGIYIERSPIHHTHLLSTPMIILQGTEDAVVPPAQAESLVRSLASANIPHSYLLFEGEGHGFRQAKNIATALESELSFLGQILGFEPATSITRVEIRRQKTY